MSFTLLLTSKSHAECLFLKTMKAPNHTGNEFWEKQFQLNYLKWYLRQVGKLIPVFPSPIKIEIIFWKYHLNNITTQRLETDVLMKPPVVQKQIYTEKLMLHSLYCYISPLLCYCHFFFKPKTIDTNLKSSKCRDTEEYKEFTYRAQAGLMRANGT